MHLRSGTVKSVPLVLSVKSGGMDPKTTDASKNGVSGVEKLEDKFDPKARSTPVADKGTHSLKPRMAANLSFSQDKPQEDIVGRFRELGISAGLEARALADFIAERVDKYEERVFRQRGEEEERLIKLKVEEEERRERIRREDLERKDRIRKEDMEREDRLRKEEEERAIRRRELDIKMQEMQNASQLSTEREEAERGKWDTMIQLLSERNASAGRGPSDGYRVKLEEWDDKQDIDQFLGHFERIATTHSWPKDMWGVRLVPCLRGAAKEAYLQMDAKEADDYEKLKSTLRHRFRRDLSFYRTKFRELKREHKETFPQFLARLKTVVENWARMAEKDLSCGSDVLDMFLQEQVLSGIHGDMEVRIREEKVATVEDLVELAQRLLEAKIGARSSKGHSSGAIQGHSKVARDEVKSKEGQQERLCHNCSSPDHLIARCPSLKKSAAASCADPLKRVLIQGETFLDIGDEGKVNGKEASFLRDTGTGMCMVSEKLVGKQTDATDEVRVVLANMQVVSAPVVVVEVESKFLKGRVKAAVFPELLTDFIVGNQVVSETGEVFSVPLMPPKEPRVDCWEESKGVDKVVFKAAMVASCCEAEQAKAETPTQVPNQGEITTEKIKAAQATDPSLARVREAARSGRTRKLVGAQVSFRYQNGVLVRVFQRGKQIFKQVCVPAKFRDEMLRLAHVDPRRGHLANKETRERVWRDFYWPSMFADIRRYGRACDLCQKFSCATKSYF